jgi:hypothetical protein
MQSWERLTDVHRHEAQCAAAQEAARGNAVAPQPGLRSPRATSFHCPARDGNVIDYTGWSAFEPAAAGITPRAEATARRRPARSYSVGLAWRTAEERAVLPAPDHEHRTILSLLRSASPDKETEAASPSGSVGGTDGPSPESPPVAAPVVLVVEEEVEGLENSDSPCTSPPASPHTSDKDQSAPPPPPVQQERRTIDEVIGAFSKMATVARGKLTRT